MFSALKTSIFLLGYEKYIKIQRGNAVYFKRVKIHGITFGISFHGGNIHFFTMEGIRKTTEKQRNDSFERIID